MNIDGVWRANLEGLLRKHGGPQALSDLLAKKTPADETQWSANYLTQLKAEKKAFGKKVAQKFERRLGKAPGWMNIPHFGHDGQPMVEAVEAPPPGKTTPLHTLSEDIYVLRTFLNALMKQMAANRPVEALLAAAEVRDTLGVKYFDAGYAPQAVDILEEAEHAAEAALTEVRRHAAASASKRARGRGAVK